MANAKLGTKAVGSIVKLKVNGTATEFIVVHQGKPSSFYDDSCNGTWLLMKNIYDLEKWNSTEGQNNDYAESAVHSYLNGELFNLFDGMVKSVIKSVNIPYDHNIGTSADNLVSAKIFLLSGYEVGFMSTSDTSLQYDGNKLNYFEESLSNSGKRVANFNGEPSPWWTRSKDRWTEGSTIAVSTEGGLGEYNSSTNYLVGIRPALILPSNALVDDSGNVTPPVDLTAHKTLINGTAYTVKGGKCLVGGTGYDIKKGRTLIGGTGYDITFAPPYDPVFANNTWEQIIEACHSNAVPGTWKVADQKPVTINGADYQIDIIGKNHDDYADGSGKAPLTFQLHDCYETKYGMNGSTTNITGWTSCAMRQKHLPAIFAYMPIAIQSGIREVNKLTSAGRQSATINTTADKLFLLSEIEIYGSTTYSFSGEGTQYDYYKMGGSIKYLNDVLTNWWTRSPANDNAREFCRARAVGTGTIDANNLNGVAFGFCF